MDDARIWHFEESLWTATPEHYRESVDEACLMVLPHPPYLYSGEAALRAVTETPRWDHVALTERQVARPQEGLIVISYKAEVSKTDAEPYSAYCSSTYRRLEHEEWRVVQHHQSLAPVHPA